MMFGERFKKAREFLGFLSQNSVAKKIGLTNQSIRKIERDEIKNLNWDYVKYLIENGINPYFLIGKSDEVAGKNLEDFVKKSEYEDVKAELEDLQNKFEIVQETLQLLQIEVDEDGNLKKRDSNI